jgi:hypothetical protein
MLKLKLAVFLALALIAGQPAAGSLSIIATVGGGPMSGVNYLTFNDLALGDATQQVNSDVEISFTPDAGVVIGALSGRYARPWVSGGSGLNFGNQADGVNTTKYITSGKDGSPNVGANATLTFNRKQTYFGLLWGSVDLYNTLKFYDGNTLVGSITGGMVNPNAVGNQGLSGTFYVNVNSTVGFNRVVAVSSNYAFEFDNVAYGNAIPEPGSLLVWGALGLAGLGFTNRRRKS